MRLCELTLSPRGVNGWQSGVLQFGRDVTSIHAANGSGKTPIIQSIVYCLGFPVTFREDIAAKCESVSLKVELGAIRYTFRRHIDRDFLLTIESSAGETTTFNNEKDFSNFFFDKIGLTIPNLVSTNNTLAQPYLSTFLPLFYLDQDTAYSLLYKAPVLFIRDQFCEMVRFALGLGPKNSFDSKKDIIRLKSELNHCDRKIVTQKELVSRISGEVTDRNSSVEELQQAIDACKAEVQTLRSSRNLKGNIQSSIDTKISEAEKAYKDTLKTILDLTIRIEGIEQIKRDIQTEIDTLSLNEEARRHFDSISDICNRPDCGLFIGSSASYAKNLLYLKDQLKDLERNTAIAKTRIQDFESIKNERKATLDSLVTQRSVNIGLDDISSLVDLIGRTTQEIVDLEKKRKSLEILKYEESIYFNLTVSRDEIQDKINQISTPSNRGDLGFLEVRVKLKNLTVKWLDILGTENVSRNIQIEPDLKMFFGGEAFDAIKGSTRVRIVLAVHAAMFEIYLEGNSREMRFLIFDTPRQHEMHTNDLDRYLVALKTMAAENNAQIIFSSTEYRYGCDSNDVEWIPKFPSKTQPMYLG